MNVRIKELGYYHPKNKMGNDYFLDEFDKKGIDIRGLIQTTGRKYRYISDNNEETSLSMAIEASKIVLNKSELTGQDVDLIVFASDNPEYLTPTNAIRIHNAINGKNHCGTYDINCNCLGMVVAVDNVSKIMKVDKNIKKALIVGSQMLQHYGDENDPMVKVMFGDMACAIILEQTEDENSYFVDSLFYTDSEMQDDVFFPINGFSKLNRKPIMKWFNTDNKRAFQPVVGNIENLLKRNNIDKSMVKKYYLSQMVESKIYEIASGLGESKDKFTYIGDKYGYTGTTSPFLALSKSLQNNDLNRGDYIVFWSIAGGTTTDTVLLRY